MQTILITCAVSLISVYFGYLLSGRTAKKTVKLQEFYKAASEFHTAFIEIQRRLDESKSFDILKPEGTGVKTILIEFIIEHEKAMIKFRPYISKCKLTNFDNAWKIYYSQENKHSECLGEYTSKDHDTTPIIDAQYEDKIRRLVLSRIEKLLSFTEIKNT